VGDHGFIPILMDLAKQTGVSAWPEDVENRWAAVHRRDAATLYRLALETGVTQAVYHAAAEEGILFRDIAQAIGNHLGYLLSRGRGSILAGLLILLLSIWPQAVNRRARYWAGTRRIQRYLLTSRRRNIRPVN
jgi:nucleoside-diphosphate-sugar epimerase